MHDMLPIADRRLGITDMTIRAKSTARRPVRLSHALVTSARSAGERANRSAAQQIEHWIRIDHLVAECDDALPNKLREALSSGKSFDDLTSIQQIVLLADAGEFFDQLDGDPRLAAVLAGQGIPLATSANGKVTYVRGRSHARK